MAVKNFKPEKFAQELAKASKEYLPKDLTDDDKNYITKNVFDYSFIAGNDIIKRFNNQFDDKQTAIIAQFIGEWAFHKSIDIIRANISTEHRAEILQQVAFAAHQEAIKSFGEEKDEDKIAARIELEVVKAYEISINTLVKAGNVTEDKVNEILSQSNINKYVQININKENQKNNKVSLNVDISRQLQRIFNCIFNNLKLLRFNELKISKELVNHDKLYKSLCVDILSIHTGNGLLSIVESEKKGMLFAKIASLRQRLTNELGFVIPLIRIKDNLSLKENEYQILLKEIPIENGVVYPDRLMVIADQWNSMGLSVPADVITGFDPTYKQPVYWLKPDQASK